MRRSRAALLAVTVSLGCVTPTAGQLPTTSAATPARFVAGWVPYWQVTEGLAGPTSAPSVIASLSPFFHVVRSATSIQLAGGSATSLGRVVSAARAQGWPVLPTVSDGMGAGGLAAVLADPGQRAAHVQALVELVIRNGYDGIDLDDESFAFRDGRASWPTTQPNWVAFVHELGAALHAQSKLLSVTVPAVWNGGASGSTVYAWPDLIGAVDTLRIMGYDYTSASSTAAGPIAPLSWVQSILAYVAQAIPADQRGKVVLGVPVYGRQWPTVIAGTCPAGLSLPVMTVAATDATALAAAHGVVPQRHGSGELTFAYDVQYSAALTATEAPPAYVPSATSDAVQPSDAAGLRPAIRIVPPGTTTGCTVRWTAFVPDTAATVERARAALDGGLGGVAIWPLGDESPDLWPALAGI